MNRKHSCSWAACNSDGVIYLNVYSKETGIGKHAWICNSHLGVVSFDIFKMITLGKTE